MKIVATIADFGAAANIGGDVERESEIIDVPDDAVPPMLKEQLEKKSQWVTISLSILKEQP